MSKLFLSSILLLVFINCSQATVYPSLKIALEPSITDVVRDDIEPLIKNLTSKPLSLGNQTISQHIKDLGTLELTLTDITLSNFDLDWAHTHFLSGDYNIQISKLSLDVSTGFHAKLGILKASGGIEIDVKEATLEIKLGKKLVDSTGTYSLTLEEASLKFKIIKFHFPNKIANWFADIFDVTVAPLIKGLV